MVLDWDYQNRWSYSTQFPPQLGKVTDGHRPQGQMHLTLIFTFPGVGTISFSWNSPEPRNCNPWVGVRWNFSQLMVNPLV